VQQGSALSSGVNGRRWTW